MKAWVIGLAALAALAGCREGRERGEALGVERERPVEAPRAPAEVEREGLRPDQRLLEREGVEREGLVPEREGIGLEGEGLMQRDGMEREGLEREGLGGD